MFTPIHPIKTKLSLYLLLLLGITITFSCNKDDWWKKYKDGENKGCIDKKKLNPARFCRKIKDPVCGCDGKDYANPCEAEKNGVIKYKPGKCTTDRTDSCFDKSRYNPNAPCTKEYNPVCGCDGKDYANPCEADRNGIVKITMGKCKSGGGTNNSDCYDKSKYDPNAPCPEELNPVCGCDGKDYSNPCQAEKNGVVKYSKGKCKGKI